MKVKKCREMSIALVCPAVSGHLAYGLRVCVRQQGTAAYKRRRISNQQEMCTVEEVSFRSLADVLNAALGSIRSLQDGQSRGSKWPPLQL